MYKIMAIEIKDIVRKTSIGEPIEFEYHQDLLNATTNMNYLDMCFGKHYKFYILKSKEDIL